MTETQTTTLPSRIAALGDDTTTIHGVAIAAGDVTRGLEDERKVWRASQLRAAAESLAGVDITVLHSEQDAGVVRRATYDDAREAVVYEADVEDAKLAEQVRGGHLDVSIEARHADGGRDEETGAMLATQIEFTGLSLVQHGAAPSNSASAGPAPQEALAARLSATQICDTLDTSLASIDGIQYSGTMGGDLDEGAIPSDDYASHYVFDGDTKTASSFPLVDADGNLRAGNVASAFQFRGDAPDEGKLLDVLAQANDVFDDPPIEPESLQDAQAADGAAGSVAAGDAGGDLPEADDGMAPEDSGRTASEAADSAVEADVEQSDTDTKTEENMSNDENNDNDNDPEPTPEERVQELKATLSDKDQRIAELEQENSELREEVDEVAEAYASALAEHGETLLTAEELQSKFTVSELAAKFDDLDAALADPEPEADPEPDVQSGAGGGEQTADLSAAGEELVAELGAADREEAVAVLESRLEKYQNAGWESNAQEVAEDLETLGVEVDA